MICVMATVSTPTLRARVGALELRRLRARSGLTQAEAARRLNWSKSKLSRIEEHETRPTDTAVRQLLQLYGIKADRHDAILQLFKDAWQRGWWTAYGDAFTGQFVMLEDQAPEIGGYENSLVPGLLQTPDYARTVIRAVRDLGETGEYDLDRLVAARMARKSVLTRATPPSIHYVISEAVVRSVVGDADLMRKQIAVLAEAAVERPNITLQILPFTAPATPALEGPFTLFGFPEDRGLDVGHSEGALGEWYAESNDQLTRLRLAFDRVCRAALTPDESVEFLVVRTQE